VTVDAAGGGGVTATVTTPAGKRTVRIAIDETLDGPTRLEPDGEGYALRVSAALTGTGEVDEAIASAVTEVMAHAESEAERRQAPEEPS